MEEIKIVDTDTKIRRAVKLMKAVSQQHNVVLSFSSGKDSCVLEFLMKEAGLRLPLVHNITTIDPEGTISFAIKHGCELYRNDLSFLDLVEKKGFPTMFRRFCCKELKERYIANYMFMGIRREESVKRTKCYTSFEQIYYYKKNVYTCRYLPMLDWTNDDILYVIKKHSLELHPIYYDAFGNVCVERRLGCIGCPLQGDRGKIEFLRYPILLKQMLRRGILFHRRMGRNENDAALNLVYNLFYSNHGYEKFKQTYLGMFPADPWEQLDSYFFLDKDDVMRGLPKPKF